MAAYYETLQKQPKEEELFGKDDEAEHGDAATTAAPPSPPPTLATLMHQTDKDGKQQHVAAPLPPVEEEEKAKEEPSFLGRLLGSFGRMKVSEAPAPAKASSSSGTTTPAQKATTGKPPLRPTAPVSSPNKRHLGMLPEVHPDDVGKKCLVLDLDETLVHSSFQPVDNADFVIPIQIEGTQHKVYVLKRPGVDKFMRRVAERYEVVIFTASLSLYADPLLDQLDIHGVVRHRLYRENCTFFQGSYVKDLTKLARPISQTIIVDNSPLSFMFQPENAIGCSSYIDEPSDAELEVIAAFLDDVEGCADVRKHCKNWRQWAYPQGKRSAMVGVHAG